MKNLRDTKTASTRIGSSKVHYWLKKSSNGQIIIWGNSEPCKKFDEKFGKGIEKTGSSRKIVKINKEYLEVLEEFARKYLVQD